MTSESPPLGVILLAVLASVKRMADEGNHRKALEVATKMLDQMGELEDAEQDSIFLAAKSSLAALAFAAAMALHDYQLALTFAEIEVETGQTDDVTSLGLVRGLNNRALAKHELGRFVEAEDDYRRALALAEELDHRQAAGLKGAIQGNLALLLQTRGQSGSAKEGMLAALRAPPTVWHTAPDVDRSNTLAQLATADKNWDQAIEHLEQGLSDPSLDDDGHRRGILLCNLGHVYAEKGDLTKAIELTQRAVEDHRSVAAKGPLCLDLLNLGVYCQRSSRRKEAVDALKEAWNLAREVAPHTLATLWILRHLGMERLASHDFRRARSALRRGLEIYEEMRPAVGRSEEEHRGMLGAYRSLTEMHLYASLHDSWLDEVADLVERAKGRIWYERIYAVALAAESAQVSSQLNWLAESEALALTRSGESSAEEAERANDVRREIEAWEQKAVPERRLPRPEGTGAALLRKLSRHNSLAVSFFVGPNATFACYAHNGSIGAYRVDAQEQELERLVQETRFSLLESRSRVANPWDARNELADLVFGKLPRDFVRDLRLVTILPDGPLWLCPFAALPAPFATVDRLADLAPIAFGPSVAVLEQLAKKRPAETEGTCLVVGDPDLGGEFAAIPGTTDQIDAFVSKMGTTGSPRILRDRDATKDRLLTELESAAYVHIGTHALADLDDGRTGIALSDGAGGSELLRPHELRSVVISAELVFLAACSTSMGRRSEGEGLMSIARAFLLSGARCVIASLWPIVDDAAARLVLSFYDHLSNGISTARSLWLARRDLQTSGDAARTWAALQAIGDADSYEDRMSTMPVDLEDIHGQH